MKEPNRDDHVYYGRRVMLDSEHLYLKELTYIAKCADRRGLPVLFVITPIPYERITRERDFNLDVFNQSLRLLSEAPVTGSTTCLNMAKLLPDDRFVDGVHWGSQGHADLAAALAPRVYEILSAREGDIRDKVSGASR
jgi:lysophospholipase L1-like esterase